jgi:hypothetical protein
VRSYTVAATPVLDDMLARRNALFSSGLGRCHRVVTRTVRGPTNGPGGLTVWLSERAPIRSDIVSIGSFRALRVVTSGLGYACTCIISCNGQLQASCASAGAYWERRAGSSVAAWAGVALLDLFR